VESLWDEVLPVEVRELPDDLAGLDRVLSDGALLIPVAEAWELAALERGRPSIPIAMFVRLMVVKQRTGWGYETLVREVSVGLAASAAVLFDWDRSARPGRVDCAQARAAAWPGGGQRDHQDGDREGSARGAVHRACGSDRFDCCRGRHPLSVGRDARAAGRQSVDPRGRQAAEADRRNDAGARSLPVDRQGRPGNFQDARAPHRRGEGPGDGAQRAGWSADRPCAKEAIRLAAAARAAARGRGAKAKLHAAGRLEELASRSRTVAEQIDRRVRGLKITDRLVSISDPDARPIRKGKLGRPTEFGYVAQICEVTENTRRGARGFILPAGHAPGNPAENTLLPQTAAELQQAGIRPREIVADGGFMPGPSSDAFPDLTDEQIHISGRHEPGSRKTRKRRARYRTGIEGRISHLKRRYGLRRSRLKGDDGMRIWTGWAILAYDLDTLAIRTH
jgi:IS5 family transposase